MTIICLKKNINYTQSDDHDGKACTYFFQMGKALQGKKIFTWYVDNHVCVLRLEARYSYNINKISSMCT